MLPALPDDELHVLVFGPGTGELVAVKAPPGKWLLIDGCAVAGVRYGVQLLEHYQALPSLIAFTHPHLDHAAGVAEVVDRATPAANMAAWPKIGLVWPSPRRYGKWTDLQARFETGLVERALAAISDRWQRAPQTQWRMVAGKTKRLGTATVTVLSPTAAEAASAFKAWRSGRDWDPNRIATALEVAWSGQRVLLGSDLIERPGQGWTRVSRRKGFSHGHLPTKVPHHGSVGAIHDIWIRGTSSRDPMFVVTPFARQNLPRFHFQGGITKMLSSAREVYLTGLPREHASQLGAPLRSRRHQLAALGKAELDPKTPGWPDCFVVVTLSVAGNIRVTHGPGSVVVLR